MVDIFEVIIFLIAGIAFIARMVSNQNKKKNEQAERNQQDVNVAAGKKQQHVQQQSVQRQPVQQQAVQQKPMQQQGQNPGTAFQGATSGKSKIEEWLHKLEMAHQEENAIRSQKQQAVKAKEAAERELKVRKRKERERKELEQQRLQEQKQKAQKEVREIPQVTPVGGLGLRSREELVRGIILSEVLGSPKSRRMGSHKV